MFTRRPAVAVLMLAGILCFPMAMWASEGSGHHAGGGIMGLHVGLPFWTIVTFVVLLLVLKKFAWKPMLSALDAREKSIREALDSAEKSRQEALKSLEVAQEKLVKAAGEARTMMENAQAQTARIKEETLAETERECNRLKNQAERQITQAKEQAVQEIWQNITLISTEIASKLLHKSLDTQEHRRLLEESLTDIRKQMHV